MKPGEVHPGSVRFSHPAPGYEFAMAGIEATSVGPARGFRNMRGFSSRFAWSQAAFETPEPVPRAGVSTTLDPSEGLSFFSS